MQDVLQRLSDWGVDLKSTMERFVDDEELYLECLQTFVDDPGFADLGEALQAKKYDRAFEISHTLKGVAGNLGLTPLFDAIVAVVEPLRAGKTDGVDELYSRMMEKYDAFRKMIP